MPCLYARAPELEARLDGLTFGNTAPFRYAVEDLARLVPKDGTHFYDQVHFTDPAQERISAILFEALVKSDLLSRAVEAID
ncbi:MAG: hypothetical protein A3I61_19920 [Acidobacteria bacterium RIFCSPLOWO2_02_FULL_68_18]|nr:MAG: hypothetical protein A3I61_19920 [Acidobacteria bacterium RIFCSPLOWO2_02_FULL_68_18]OFW48269.1 MAG: hypothetical protein A3G77_03220 [Acidobacteria bacterium RIFCSPLOWO2_12_FULL_68_19]